MEGQLLFITHQSQKLIISAKSNLYFPFRSMYKPSVLSVGQRQQCRVKSDTEQAVTEFSILN